MQQAQVQKTVSGFRIEGRWEDIVNTSKEVSTAMKDEAVDSNDLKDWDEWRPREEERLDKEVREKTVKKACVNPNKVESKGKTAVETVGEAVGDMGRAVEKATKGEKTEASEKSKEAMKEAALSIDTVVRKSVRSVELVVYKHIVTRTNPHYFESKLISASVDKKFTFPGRKSEAAYEMDVHIRDESVREEVTASVQELE